ncbi:hypothetical protein [uncultured Ruegeria sp.]|uniref:hypothetical protein n=1 Tax=uncultured Ruegeria sp. TaxID=259304 RepID=UPI00260A9AC8|nr:hypothetical protein [uncultured Ruegeria sp.]
MGGTESKATVSKVLHKGVRIESRGSVLSEFDTMKRILDSMPELMARRLDAIWCDSYAGASYTVSVRDGLWTPELKCALSDGVMEGAGGHNGIVIEASDGSVYHLEPDWGEPIGDT